MSSREDIKNTSYALAIEQVLLMAQNGQTPAQIIKSTNVDWMKPNPTWDDAVYVLAYAYRVMPLRASKHPKGSGEACAPRPLHATSKDRDCLSCGETFRSRGSSNQICPKCHERNKQYDGKLIEGKAL